MSKLTRWEKGNAATPPILASSAGKAILTHHVRHIACPMCSLMARVDLLEKGPYPPYSRMQHYGGSEENTTGRPCRRLGLMVWDAPLPIERADREQLLANLSHAIAVLQEEREFVPPKRKRVTPPTVVVTPAPPKPKRKVAPKVKPPEKPEAELLSKEEARQLKKLLQASEQGVVTPQSQRRILELETKAAGGKTPPRVMEEKWRQVKRKNVTEADKDLEDLRFRGYETADCSDALEAYSEISREDYESNEEYKAKRANAWEEFLDCLHEMVPEET